MDHNAHVLQNMAAIGPLDCKAAGCKGRETGGTSMTADPRPYMPKAQRTDWRTPPALFDKLAAEFGPFDLDPCGEHSSYASQRCADYWTTGGMVLPWHGRVFVNPPYGRHLGLWVMKAVLSVQWGEATRVVALLPARTEVKWWQRYVMHQSGPGDSCIQVAALVRFLPGRLKFEGAKNAAPFPSVVVVWE